MYCAKCGSYTENEELCAQCAAEANPIPQAPVTKAKSASAFDFKKLLNQFDLSMIFKLAVLLVAIVTFLMQFSNLIAERKSEITSTDYKEYYEELEEDKEELSDSDRIKDYLKTDRSSIYGNSEYTGELNERRIGYAEYLLQWSFLAFALYLGCFLASLYKKNEKALLICQGLFFSIMFIAFIIVWFATFTGKSYDALSSLDLYYTTNVGVTFAWFIGFLFSFVGIAATALNALSLNKADK